MDSRRSSRVRRLQPDVILMDIRMPGWTGSRRRGSWPPKTVPTKILILTTFDIDEYVIEAIRAGASGFLLKDVRPERPDRGDPDRRPGRRPPRPVGDPTLLELIAPSLPRSARQRWACLDALTQTERKVLALVGRGVSNHEIAAELFVADTTVRTHIRHILEKLELRDRVQAVVLAYDTGLVQPHAS